MTIDYAYDKNGQLMWTKEDLEAAFVADPIISKIWVTNKGEIIMSFEQISRYRVEQNRLSAQMPVATQIIVTDGGPWCEHNVPCPVCGDNKAIFFLNRGVFIPCDKCTQAGWKLTLVKKHWWQFWRRRA